MSSISELEHFIGTSQETVMIAGELLGFSVNVSESSSNAGVLLFSSLFLTTATVASAVDFFSSTFASFSSGGFASRDPVNFLTSAVLSEISSSFPVSSLVTRSKKNGLKH